MTKKSIRWSGLPTQEEVDENEGFVYIIKNLKDNMYYIGKKSFWSNRTLKPLKGKTRKRHVRTESEWRSYTGSSNWLNEDIESMGIENFSKQILKVCRTKSELSYEELLWQIKLDVLKDLKSYNMIVNVRISVRKDKDICKAVVIEDD